VILISLIGKQKAGDRKRETEAMNKKIGCGMGEVFSIQCSVFRRGTHANRHTEGFKLGRFCRCLASSLRLRKFSVFSFQSSDLNTEHRTLNTLFTLLTLLLLLALAPRAEAGVAASGGTMTYTSENGTNYIFHTFTTVGSNSFIVSSGGNVEVLVVAGGGGGGYWGTQGAGGGGGGVTNNTAFAVVGGSNYTVTVGAGGLGSWGGPNAANVRQATSGSNSVFGSITALGGGNGGSGGQTSGRGIGVVGSSGGLSQGSDANNLGTPGQGNNGGAGQGSPNFGQGGGGGAGANGQAGTTTYGGAGGIGLYFSAFANWGDTSHLGYFGGGGGGGYRNGSATGGGAGGWGGGGTGGNQGGSTLNNGQANTGGGGGGADYKDGPTSSKAGDGGSGIVIVRYVGSTMPSMKITFGGYTNRSEVLYNFPVLVVFSNNVGGSSSFNYSNFVSSSGYDLRFGTNSKPPTIGLNYEIESWNPNGASYVWVQVPTIPANGSGAIWANWGDPANSAQLPCTTNGAVWNSDYRAVWHLQQTGTGSAGDYKDSTINANNSTNTANQPTFISGGKIGGAQSCSSGSILVSDSTSLRPTNITLEAWFTISSTNPQNYSILQKDNSSSWVPPYLSWLVRVSSLTSIEYDVGNGSKYSAVTYAVPTLATGVWHHVAMTYNGTTCIDYFDGVKVGANTIVSGNIAYQSTPASIGKSLNGNVDEVRVSSTPASSNWVWACYLNQASNTVFNNYGVMVKQRVPKGTVIMMR
jgi:hypothetical protein